MIEQFWLFHCGYFRIFEHLIHRGGSWRRIRLPFLCAVLVHPEHGPVVIDAPFGHEGPANAGAVLGTIFRTFGQTFKRDWAVVERIRECGFRAAEVNHVLMTHLHYDHTGGMKSLAHATFHVQADEWEFANSEGGLTSGYITNDYRALRNVNTFEGEDVDLFGDGSVIALARPGHSVGHTGFRVTLTTGKVIEFLGDAGFAVDHIEASKELGGFPRRVAHDLLKTEETLVALREDANRHPDVIRIVSHDEEWGTRCLRAPIPLHD